MSGVRALAVLVAAMWFSTAAVAAASSGSSASGRHVKEVWNPPEARSGARHGAHHATRAHSGSVHHETRGKHGHTGEPASHASHARNHHVGAAKPNAKTGGGHKTVSSGARRAPAKHDDPHSRKVGSPAHSVAHAEPKHVKPVKTPTAAQPAPQQRKPATQTAPASAVQPHAQAIKPPQALPPILH